MKLKYLTAEDYQLLKTKTYTVTYRQHEVILAEGDRLSAIFWIQQGTVRVEQQRLGKGVAIAILSQDDWFGEMSYVEKTTASATIIANEQVEVSVLPHREIDALVDFLPSFGLRLYKSLAYNLSTRLRHTSRLIPSLMAESLTQLINLTPIPYDCLSPQLIVAVNEFKAGMDTVASKVNSGDYSIDPIQTSISSYCSGILTQLQQQIQQHPEQEYQFGTYVWRETFAYLMQSSLINAAFRQSRNYSDSYIMPILCQNRPTGDGILGIYIDTWVRSQPTIISLKYRSPIIIETIKEIRSRWTKTEPMPVTNLASGSISEIVDLFLASQPPNLKITCIDRDLHNLATAAAFAQKLGFAQHLTLIGDSIRLLWQGYNSTRIPPQQVIYSLSLCNYLSDQELLLLLDWIYHQLLWGGTVILNNFTTNNPDRILLKHIFQWQLVYRSVADWHQIIAQSPFAACDTEIQLGEEDVELFILCTKHH